MKEISEQMKLELRKMDLRIKNKVIHLRELHEKIQNLNEEIDKLEAGIVKDCTVISNIGLKNRRADGKPESPEQEAKKRHYNSALYEAKLNFIKQNLSEETIREINEKMPKSYGEF